ncbi:MAG: septal ring lytic transglycosylase RlpA family protein [Bacteroidia bacterium]|nr:septal ring lytic transglycosylase RlpA family protein [Bacteroidia bacterium]MDW8235139.1 septal ring lytic transglycosylase RlpA family protein [Bacteroidia bacterium]
MGQINSLTLLTVLSAWSLSQLLAQIGYTEEGEASYYAPSFHGRRTASGEKYDRNALTAAHRTLPFGTQIRVTEKRSGRSVIVRINDRGPHRVGRIVDLSERAARELGIIAQGIAQVHIEVVGSPASLPAEASQYTFFTPEGKPLTPRPFSIQIGAFKDEANALSLAQNASNELKEAVFLWRTRDGYKVLVGHFSARKEAERLRNLLRKQGWPSFVVHLPL